MSAPDVSSVDVTQAARDRWVVMIRPAGKRPMTCLHNHRTQQAANMCAMRKRYALGIPVDGGAR